jgi:hypothetical protein
VGKIISGAWGLTQIALIMGGVVALVALMVWLAGLALALRGSEPKDRPQILRAYASCRPPVLRQPTIQIQTAARHEQMPDESSPSG